MKISKKKILLFLDNAPSHYLPSLSNIEIKTFRANMTAEAQPMDRGIIQAVKLRYRTRLMERSFNGI